MQIDSLLVFDPSGTAITVTADSTNILDMGAERDMGPGSKLRAFIAIQTTFTAAGAATLQVQLMGAPNNGGVPGAFAILSQTDAIGKANLTIGETIDMPLPAMPPQMGALHPPRFYKLHYIVGTGPMTAGSVEAWLTGGEVDENFAYPNNYVAV